VIRGVWGNRTCVFLSPPLSHGFIFSQCPDPCPANTRCTARTNPPTASTYKAELNEQQHAAVVSPPGQSLVIAGAGSGKTRTLTYRVAWLLDNGVQPESILLLTFTNKAAREMQERVQALVSLDASRIWGGTFHSIGNRLPALQRRAPRLPQRLLHHGPRGPEGSPRNRHRRQRHRYHQLPLPEGRGARRHLLLADNTCESIEEIIDTRYPYFDKLDRGHH
jgi:DNA helicase-2/ATP-dependent DNA helicase PcrA